MKDSDRPIGEIDLKNSDRSPMETQDTFDCFITEAEGSVERLLKTGTYIDFTGYAPQEMFAAACDVQAIQIVASRLSTAHEITTLDQAKQFVTARLTQKSPTPTKRSIRKFYRLLRDIEMLEKLRDNYVKILRYKRDIRDLPRTLQRNYECQARNYPTTCFAVV